jgi:hypothetical protein
MHLGFFYINIVVRFSTGHLSVFCDDLLGSPILLLFGSLSLANCSSLFQISVRHNPTNIGTSPVAAIYRLTGLGWVQNIGTILIAPRRLQGTNKGSKRYKFFAAFGFLMLNDNLALEIQTMSSVDFYRF